MGRRGGQAKKHPKPQHLNQTQPQKNSKAGVWTEQDDPRRPTDQVSYRSPSQDYMTDFWAELSGAERDGGGEKGGCRRAVPDPFGGRFWGVGEGKKCIKLRYKVFPSENAFLCSELTPGMFFCAQWLLIYMREIRIKTRVQLGRRLGT